MMSKVNIKSKNEWRFTRVCSISDYEVPIIIECIDSLCGEEVELFFEHKRSKGNFSRITGTIRKMEEQTPPKHYSYTTYIVEGQFGHIYLSVHDVESINLSTRKIEIEPC